LFDETDANNSTAIQPFALWTLLMRRKNNQLTNEESFSDDPRLNATKAKKLTRIQQRELLKILRMLRGNSNIENPGTIS